MKPFLGIVMLLFVLLNVAHAQQDADARYVSIYNIIQQADNPADGGQARDALAAYSEAKSRLEESLGSSDAAGAVAAMLRKFPIPQRLRDVGFDAAKADFVANEIAAASIASPRPVSASDVRDLLAAAY